MPDDHHIKGGDVGDEEDTATRRITRAVRDTQQTVLGAADRIGDLHRRVDSIDGRLAGVEVSSARIEGGIDILIEELKVARQERSSIRIIETQAIVEVEKTDKISKISEESAKRSDRRQLVIKIMAVVGPIVAALIGVSAGRC